MSITAQNAELTLEQAAAQFKKITTPEPESNTEISEEPATEVDSDAGNAEPQETARQREEEADTSADEQTIDADQFATLLGLDADKLLVDDSGNVKFKTKVDGEEGDATLADLIERYQRDANLTNRSKDVAELKKKAEEQVNALLEKVNTAARQADTLFQALEAEVLAPYQSIDWNDLRVTDPAEFAARRQEFNDARSRLAQKRDEVMKKLGEDYMFAEQQITNQRSTYLQDQASQLPKLIPNWGDSVKTDITNYLSNQGFSKEEISMVGDARMVALANKAMLYDRGKTAATSKLEKALPKVLKPGGKPSAQSIKGETIKVASERLKNSGSLADAVALLKLKTGKDK